MNDKLTIPNNIKVGFQTRQDTYTGKLAYVVFIDTKGKLRKQPSWDDWRDHKIPPQDFDNIPTSGFVLNRDVGGAHRSYNWNARREKVRVYDPRDFEFEISVENLLFILQECSAIKGKGLEGDFVYSWSGTEIVLLPITSQEYKNSLIHNELQLKKVSKKDVIPGCTFLTKDKEEVMYLGKFDWFEKKCVNKKVIDQHGNRIYDYSEQIAPENKHIFVYLNTTSPIKREGKCKYFTQSGFNKLATIINDTPSPQFANEFEKLSKSRWVSKPLKFVIKNKTLTARNLESHYSRSFCVPLDNEYYLGGISQDSHYQAETKTYQIECTAKATLENGIYKEVYRHGYGQHFFKRIKLSLEEVQSIVKELLIECENGSTYNPGEE